MNENDQKIAEELGHDFKAIQRSVKSIEPRFAGGSGYVFRVELKTGQERALKVFRPDQVYQETLLEGFRREGERLQRMEHARIVKVHEVSSATFDSVNAQLPFFLMEWLPYSSLDQALHSGLTLTLQMIISVLRQTLEALKYLHGLNPPLCHLDVKEANLLVDSSDPNAPQIKVSDFGLAKEVSTDSATTEVRGSLHYWPLDWQRRLQGMVPTNNNRAIIFLPRKEIPTTVDLHMLSVTLNRLLDKVEPHQPQDYLQRALSLLGRLIIESVPAKERHKFSSPIIEGFNNLCLNLSAIQEILKSHYFMGKTLTAVGKTEWADIKWNDHSIADKKTIINGADLVFIASETVADWTKAQQSLTDGCVNSRLVDCSDAHRFSDADNKDRLANCFTWIKADTTFEGLRQAVFEYPSRIQIAENPPLEPLLQIKRVKLDFPPTTELHREERSDAFCFRGAFDFDLSPYLTCIIGGRGTGKSTLLNLIHEKLDPKSTEFFKGNALTPRDVTVESSVTIEGVSERKVVEFLQQNEIEQFASDHKRLTSAIFTRLRKLDSAGLLKSRETAIGDAVRSVEEQIERVVSHQDLSLKLSTSERELVTQKGLVESFQNTEYKRINEELGRSNRELQNLRTSKAHLEGLAQDLQAVLKKYDVAATDSPLNEVDEQIIKTIKLVQKALDDAFGQYSAGRTSAQEVLLGVTIKRLRGELETFLKERGLSAENQSDVGRASERIAELEEEIANYQRKLEILRVGMIGFVVQREETSLYSAAVGELLLPINTELTGLSSEVKPIELRYTFDMKSFRGAMTRYIADALGQVENRAAREDFIDSKLEGLDFAALPDRNLAASNIPDDSSVYGKLLRDFFLQGVNYELLKLQAERTLLDVQKLGQIHVLYDGKPVENSSFGQRCTAVIVVLLLLGNMPIVIDEPEAHLDSALIAKYLVDLIKSRKNHRQIIFATHNANLVINGDAELIHCLSMDNTKITKVISTTIEDLTHRTLLLALEGGEEAFHQREKRYGID